MVVAISKDVLDALQAKFESVLPHLDERQQRLGVAELEAGEAPLGSTRRPGGGRKSVTETDPDLGHRAARVGGTDPAG